MDLKPVSFIDEQIEVRFDAPPALEKKPLAPDLLVWRGESLRVTEVLSEWIDFERRGRMVRNMRPAHAAVAASRGSRNVGRFFFRVRVEDDRIFDVYFDRGIKSADETKGEWVLFREMA
jgi:hypothetical protein